MKITIESISGSVHHIDDVTSVHSDLHYLGMKDQNKESFKGKTILYTIKDKEGSNVIPIEEIAWIEVDQ